MSVKVSRRAVLAAFAPSNRTSVGVIGVGRQTVYVNLKQFLDMPEVQIVAVCDVDRWRLQNAKRQVEENQGANTCRAYLDYRDLLSSPSVDAVMVATPDHWHVPISMDAIRAGKDVSCEKPLTRCIGEGRLLANLVKRHKRVFRTDSEYRSKPWYHQAREAVLNGRIGQLEVIHTRVPKGDEPCPPQPEMPIPPELDYDRWQGNAPRAPYTEKRVHKPHAYERPGWMRRLEYCDGMVTNWGTHHNDLAQSANGTDRSGPIEVEGKGAYPEPESFWQVLLDFEINYRYANGVRLVYKIAPQPSIRFEGTEGWIYADDTGKIEASKPSILSPPSGSNWIRLPKKIDKQDFIDAVRSRGETMVDAEVGHRTTSVCHLGHIAIQVGKRLAWDPVHERFTNNESANAFIKHPIHGARST